MPINVFIANRDTLACTGLASIINSDGAFKVVGSTTSGKKARAELRKNKRIGLLILDAGLKEVSGFELMKNVFSECPHLKILLISSTLHEYTLQYMSKHGVSGILPAGAKPKEITNALNVISKGECYYSKVAKKEMFDEVRKPDFPVIMLPDAKLSFLEFCCTAMRYEEMAERLELSYRTIDGYRDYFQQHFHLKNRSDIMMFALRTGLVTL